jgi:hypothetical protein
MKSNGNRLFGIAKNLGPFGNGRAHRDAAPKGRDVLGVNARSLSMSAGGRHSCGADSAADGASVRCFGG